MTYESGAAFRRALEARLRNQSLASGLPLLRLRKMVAFERFLARLVSAQPGLWVLKGGLSLQLRLGSHARTTQDMDLLLTQVSLAANIHPLLVKAALLELHDWFSFEVARPVDPALPRLSVQAILDGRPFETFHVDVGSTDMLLEPPELLQAPALLEFAGLPAPLIPCYPLPQQIAEKLHVYTRSYPAGESSRVKDWVDILLLAQFGPLAATSLQQAIRLTFERRQAQPLPSRLPAPPTAWSRPFQRLSQAVGLPYLGLAEADQAIRLFLEPVLQEQTTGLTWNPLRWAWE
jgi:hypothetical protein